MNINEPNKKLDELLKLPQETEWVEFKHNNDNPDEIGEYLSAIANEAALHGKKFGYIVWGIENDTCRIVGTTFQPKKQKKGGEVLENWLLHLLSPRIDFTIHEFRYGGLPVVIFEVQAANSTPVRFSGEEFIRVGSYKKKLKDFPEKERKLWHLLSGAGEDWSSNIHEEATISNLAPEAIAFARKQYQKKHPQLAGEVERWDDATFLDKARVCIEGKIPNAALLLLGKAESSNMISPALAQITWVLRNKKGIEEDYEHFHAPLILAVDKVLARIRNLTIRHMPSGTLFPMEVSQYDPWVVREMLNNCIAHQDYTLGGRINVVEAPDSLLFTNMGSFLPGSVNDVIRRDAPPEQYRNGLLTQAMFNLNMIDTIGSGIKRIFSTQRERYFPMPDYDFMEVDRVKVRLFGTILDEKYTRLLTRRTDLDIWDVIALDKVQKKRTLTETEFRSLKLQKLIEGRRPNLHVSSDIAATTVTKADYIRQRAFDKSHYKKMVLAYLGKFGSARRKDLDELLLNKLSDILTKEQKKTFITNLLQEMRREDLSIKSTGATRSAQWILYNSETKNDN